MSVVSLENMCVISENMCVDRKVRLLKLKRGGSVSVVSLKNPSELVYYVGSHMRQDYECCEPQESW